MAEKPLQFLTTTNDYLEKVPENIISAFDNMIGSGEKIGQGKVDAICAWLAWKVNIAIERKRQAVIKTLHDQYMSNAQGPVFKAANAIMSFVSDPLGAIGDFASAIFAPVNKVLAWVKALVKEIPRLAANLARIVSALPPSPPNPHINYDKFKLKVGSISMGAIMAGTAGMKSPEEMFPEPPKPFSKESFAADFENVKVSLKESRDKFILKKEDKEAIAKNPVPTSPIQSSILDSFTDSSPSSIFDTDLG